ncbi:hypothetical protein RIF29_36733 [Crotalaria pallida]|uniref:Uncharacterized protein n=1 Tax=Crotalaria pallida TaxID=3830 RepID=A0AAN9EH05_CROPI
MSPLHHPSASSHVTPNQLLQSSLALMHATYYHALEPYSYPVMTFLLPNFSFIIIFFLLSFTQTQVHITQHNTTQHNNSSSYNYYYLYCPHSRQPHSS